MNSAADFVDYLDSIGIGSRKESLFTPAGYVYEKRPLAILLQESSGTEVPDVTIDADHINLRITVSGSYGQEGERSVSAIAYKAYAALRLILDLQINKTLYYCVQAQGPPVHVGYDEFERSVYEFTVSLYRYLNEV